MSQTHVVLLHGLFRSRFSLWKLERSLTDQGYEVWNKGYPSTRCSINEHADRLATEMLQRYQSDSNDVFLVTHSMGGIVARALLSRHREKFPAIKRMVMLAPPNQGAQLVDRLKHLWLFKVVAGVSGRELSRDEMGPAEIYGNYTIPEGIEVGIIAGGTGEDKGYAPWLEGDNDGTVEVSSTFLSGSKDHILVPHIHTFIMNAREAIQNTTHFLEHGRFTDEAQRLGSNIEPEETPETTPDVAPSAPSEVPE